MAQVGKSLVNARQAGHKEPEICAFYAGSQTKLHAIPGVQQATFPYHPLLGESTWSSPAVPVDTEITPGAIPHILLAGADSAIATGPALFRLQ